MSILPNGQPIQQQMPVAPWLIQVNGQIHVRHEGNLRIIEIIHPSGILAAQIPLDPIAAATIAKALSPSIDVPT